MNNCGCRFCTHDQLSYFLYTFLYTDIFLCIHTLYLYDHKTCNFSKTHSKKLFLKWHNNSLKSENNQKHNIYQASEKSTLTQIKSTTHQECRSCLQQFLLLSLVVENSEETGAAPVLLLSGGSCVGRYWKLNMG